MKIEEVVIETKDMRVQLEETGETEMDQKIIRDINQKEEINMSRNTPKKMKREEIMERGPESQEEAIEVKRMLQKKLRLKLRKSISRKSKKWSRRTMNLTRILKN